MKPERRFGLSWHLMLCCGLTLALLAPAMHNACAGPAACKVEKTTFKGWRVFKLSNGLATLFVAPRIGGRVIQFQLADHPFFFVNNDLAGKVFPAEENGGGKGGWKNYGGSKLWPAPQGWQSDDQWPGPPDPVLDGGEFTGEVTKNSPGHVAVTVTSPPDARTGIQFSRTVNLFAGGTRVRLDCAMKNISRRPVRWAIWEVTQLDTADAADPTRFNDDFWVYCPLNPRSLHPQGFAKMFGQANHPSFQADRASGTFTVKYDHRVGKVGLDSSAGWLAAVNGKSDSCFVGGFDFVPGATYPDNASVEFWLNGAGEFIINGVTITNAATPAKTPYFLEAEILSPLARLQPEQDYQFEINWFAVRCPKPIVEVTTAGTVNKALSASIRDGQVRLEGVFGVFCRGKAEAVFKDAFGKVAGREDLGGVEPNRVFRLSRQVRLPKDAFRVSVVVLDEAGENRGVLGNVIFSDKTP